MDFRFLRQLTNAMDGETAKIAYETLQAQGMEVYVASSEEKDSFLLVLSVEEAAEAEVFYVAAAEREQAVSCLKEVNLSAIVSEDIQPVTGETELEKAERLYYKKRKRTMIAWLVMILVAMCYYLLKAYVM